LAREEIARRRFFAGGFRRLFEREGRLFFGFRNAVRVKPGNAGAIGRNLGGTGACGLCFRGKTGKHRGEYAEGRFFPGIPPRAERAPLSAYTLRLPGGGRFRGHVPRRFNMGGYIDHRPASFCPQFPEAASKGGNAEESSIQAGRPPRHLPLQFRRALRLHERKPVGDY
jgi:hypothetical protein